MNWFSTTTEAVDTAFYVMLAIAVAMLVLVTVLMVWFAVRYHRKRHPNAEQSEGHTLLEIVWTVIPTILALGMFYIGWTGYKFMRNVPDNAVQVKATGRMWSWEFEYGNGKKSTELYVPKGVPVKVNLKSADVLHSFYIPAYRVKQDVVPGMETYLWFQPVDTGIYDIFCAEYCGQRHANMMTKVVVVPMDEYLRWVEKDVSPAAAAPAGGASEEDKTAALAAAGERLSRIKGCTACHSADGSRLVGPSYKGLFGSAATVIASGETREVSVDEAYLRRSILEPMADVVQGYQPVMPTLEMTDEEVNALVAYLKSLR
jgi:cytochrome c oxidase subunit 2